MNKHVLELTLGEKIRGKMNEIETNANRQGHLSYKTLVGMEKQENLLNETKQTMTKPKPVVYSNFRNKRKRSDIPARIIVVFLLALLCLVLFSGGDK